MTEPFRPLVHSQSDLEACWRHLIQPLGFSGESLWLMPIGDDDRPLPQVIEIADAEDIGPDDVQALTVLLEMLRGDLDVDRVALLRSRPGSNGLTHADRVVAQALYDAAAAAGMPRDPVHVATDVDIHPVPLDDLPMAG